jgi:hypothetical protein
MSTLTMYLQSCYSGTALDLPCIVWRLFFQIALSHPTYFAQWGGQASHTPREIMALTREGELCGRCKYYLFRWESIVCNVCLGLFER